MAAKAQQREGSAMPLGLPVALLFAAQAAAPPPQTQPTPTADCPAHAPDPKSGPIVICAPKSQGYRLDPDVLEAKREKKNQAGRPHNPHEAYRDKGCAIGPTGCPPAPINLLAAGLAAAQMGARLAKGQEIGSMFRTTPEPSEYQLYLEAKKRREEKEADAAGEKAKAAAQAAAAGKPAETKD
jgi:hypothetical protein